ncbi:MAG TPA: glycosyltransferase [Candidatus Kapabacteria bacterium]|nr:glycosyltransferase [Candidatus Kapabacteria bacterium]
MLGALFIILLVPAIYCYLGYPLVMRWLAKSRFRAWKKDESHRPSISVILSAFNEEKSIEACVLSLLDQDYPADKVEILVGSDGSSDATNEILSSLAAENGRVRPYLFTDRRGKMSVLNDLVSKSKGEILMFVDADVTIDPASFKAHVRHYADPEVACVSGRLLLGDTSDGIAGSESEYLSLENKLRESESRVFATIGNFGCNYSLRKTEFQEFPIAAIHDDQFSVLQVLERGKRTICDNESISFEPVVVRTMADDFKRKSRNAGRGLRTVLMFPQMVSPSSGLPSLMIWSHKILRWITPFFLLAILVLGLLVQMLSATTLTAFNLILLVIAGVMVLGFLFEKANVKVPVVSHLYWFGVMNIAFAMGTLNYMLDKEPNLWVQSSRADHARDEITATEKEAVQL